MLVAWFNTVPSESLPTTWSAYTGRFHEQCQSQVVLESAFIAFIYNCFWLPSEKSYTLMSLSTQFLPRIQQKYPWIWLLQRHYSWVKNSTINIVHPVVSQMIEKKTCICYFSSIRNRVYPSMQTTTVNTTCFLFQCLYESHSLILTYSPFGNYWIVWHEEVSLQLFILGTNFVNICIICNFFWSVFTQCWV